MNDLQIKRLVDGLRRLLLQWELDFSTNNANSKFYDTDAKILAEQNLKKYGDDFRQFISAYSMGCYRFLTENYERIMSITANDFGVNNER